jgi:hypothetical protein
MPSDASLSRRSSSITKPADSAIARRRTIVWSAVLTLQNGFHGAIRSLGNGPYLHYVRKPS